VSDGGGGGEGGGKRKKKKKHEEHENHERWLVSYADFITLLFAFFTVLYATAETNQEKLEAVVNGMNAAFSGGIPSSAFGGAIMGTTFSDLAPTQLSVDMVSDPEASSLRRTLDGSLTNHTVQIGLVEQRLAVSLRDRMMFQKGSAELSPAAFGRLAEVAEALKSTDAVVEVVGRADGLPLDPGSPFKDNWDLASERSAAATRYLVSRGLPVERITSSAKIVSDEDPDARAVTLRVGVQDPVSAGQLHAILAEWADE
jgi:chemotaxis protein MotB